MRHVHVVPASWERHTTPLLPTAHTERPAASATMPYRFTLVLHGVAGSVHVSPWSVGWGEAWLGPGVGKHVVVPAGALPVPVSG